MITTGSRFVVAMMVGFSLLLPPMLAAHCDTMGGPVIADAKIALETRDLTPALKWVKPEHEGEIRAAFTLTLKARAQGPEAHELADRFFFETLVRVHREGEGARYTGLKPMEAVEPITVESDKALESGNLDTLMKSLQKNTAKGVRRRFARALEARKHANESVAAGREYVEAYIEFTHYVEALYEGSGNPPHPEVHLAGEHSN
jgi:hypothetical protein